MKASKVTVAFVLVSLVLVAIGFFLLVFNVQILQRRINKEKKLEDGLEAFNSWFNIPAPLYLNVYVFNLTNVDEVANGSERLEVKEIGPYAFRDYRNKIIYENDGQTITYLPQSLFEFVPEKSAPNLSLSDRITTVNIPLIVAARMTQEFASKPFVVNVISKIIEENHNLIETRTVDELVFGGYVAPIFEKMREFQGYMEQMGIHRDIPERMAILFDRNMTDKEGNWTIGTGSRDGSDFASLHLWNGNDTIGKWDKVCNIPRGTDGIQFHSDMTHEIKPEVFIGTFCRSISFTFEKEDEVLGIKANKYSMDSLYDSNVESDRCYCTPEFDCERNGLMHIGPCLQGAPIFLSKPHFLGAPIYRTNITGVNPDALKHDGWLKIEPWLGTTLLAGVKLQLNIALKPESSLKIPFADNMLPLIWIDGTNDFDTEQVHKLNSLLFNKITLLRSLASVLLVSGLVLAAGFFLYTRRQRSNIQRNT